MNSIENAVVTAVYDALQPEYPGIAVYSDVIAKEPMFPCVTVVESGNSCSVDTIDSSAIEKFSDVMYQVDVYSNLDRGRKAECKSILSIIDSKLIGFGFVRTMIAQTPNLDGNNIYRLTARYTARVDRYDTIYRR